VMAPGRSTADERVDLPGGERDESVRLLSASHTAGALAKGATEEMLGELLAVVGMANEDERAGGRFPGGN